MFHLRRNLHFVHCEKDMHLKKKKKKKKQEKVHYCVIRNKKIKNEAAISLCRTFMGRKLFDNVFLLFRKNSVALVRVFNGFCLLVATFFFQKFG